MDKQYDYKTHEKRAQEFWESAETYKAHNNPGPLYSVDTPPPTVSGSLHIGHIFSYTQTDILVRYKRMSGFSVFYPFGFDDNGLPTERFVEKKLSISSYALGRSEFIKKCLQETVGVENEFKTLWQAMGLSVDWDLCYSTISDSTRKISQESFIELFKKGYIYRRSEPALYCTSCRTSVAQAELDDAEKPSVFNDIVFRDQKGQDLIIGTTRPELLPSCVAVLYNPADERYQHLKGSQVTVPVFGFSVPVLEDEEVDIEKGSGLVMCCTFGDKKDISWYKKFNLPYKQSIGFDGKFTKITGILEGLKVAAARERILVELTAQGLLLNQKPIMHAVNVHERCKNEIEYLDLPQWFVRLLDFKEQFLAEADKINWYPAFMKTRYKNWVENLGWDWGISRQRFYGIPFPVWHCEQCNEIILADVKDLPIDPQETPYNGTCPKCKSGDLKPDTDVMDTWNTSSLTPQICFGFFDKKAVSPFTEEIKKEFLPMSMRPQAHDIIRTWAFDTIVKSWMHHGTIPWHDIVISGHVLSGAGGKLSKSKGGGKLAPEDLLKSYPADVIRYWTAAGSLGQDVSFSEDQLKIGQRLITKIWNAFRFISEHAPEQKNIEPRNEHVVGVPNQWILHEATQCFALYKKYLDGYEFNLALDTVEKFFWTKFCDNYLELIKDQLFNPGNYSVDEVTSTRTTLYEVGLRILQMYAPYLPHVTEALYQSLYHEVFEQKSIHQLRFVRIQHAYDFQQSAHAMHLVISLISQVRRLKTEHQLSLRAELTVLEIYAEDLQQLHSMAVHEPLLRGITQAKKIVYRDKKLGASFLDVPNNTAHVELVVA